MTRRLLPALCAGLLPARARGRAGRGMTLIEVMMAAGILIFGVVAIIAAIATAQRAHQRALHESDAVQVGNSVLAEWRAAMARGALLDVPAPNMPFEFLPQHRDYPDYRYAVALTKLEPRRASGAPPLGEEYYVEVKVYWHQRGDEHSATFNTVMLRRFD